MIVQSPVLVLPVCTAARCELTVASAADQCRQWMCSARADCAGVGRTDERDESLAELSGQRKGWAPAGPVPRSPADGT